MLRRFFAMLLGAAGAALCQSPAGVPTGDVGARAIHWQRSLADAKALAAVTGRPLLLALNMDGESASDRIGHEQYRDPAFVALTRKCVCLGASVFRHNARDHDDQGRRIPCPRFHGITCGEHIALEPVIFDAYLADGERVAPRHALVRPDGTKAFDLSLCYDLKDVDRALAAAVADVPEPADEAPPSRVWAALAARRDAVGRAALEAAVASATDEATLRDALAAIGTNGDAASLDALRPLFLRGWRLSERLRRELDKIANALDADGAFVLQRDALQSLGAALGDPGPDDLQWTWSPDLHEQVPPPGARRSFFAARAAVSRLLRKPEPVDLRSLLQTAGVVTRREASLPLAGGPTDQLPELVELERRLDKLDREGERVRATAVWQASFAKASLDLGRLRLADNHRGVALLFDDAARYFERATASPDAKYEWWIERARCAYFRQRFAEQAACASKAFAMAAGGESMPRESELVASPVLADARAIEALRWLGDAHARLLAERAAGPFEAEVGGMIDALRALALVAASPFGRDADWITLAGLCGSLGLLREQVAVAYAGAMRFPAVRELRNTLNAALWQSGRPELMPVAAESIEQAHAPSAEAAWCAGYAWILAAEDLRRREDPYAAIAAYGSASEWYGRAADRDAQYRDDCKYYQAVASVGVGMAEASAGNQHGAAASLVTADGKNRIKELRDGLGYDVFDFVDRILEWRPSGSQLKPEQLRGWLNAHGNDPFWANAISDASLREALRADGRNPERVERITVDAAGKHIKTPMGLPTAQGDDFLRQAIDAGRAAVANTRNDEDKVPLAQALTIAAERELERGKLDRIAAFVTEAAPLVGLLPPAEGADEATLRALVAELRQKLGEARPRFRPGR